MARPHAFREPAAPSRPVVALCHWEDWNYGHDHNGKPYWVPSGDEPEACRASMGAKYLTVWLPKGAVIRMRLGRFGGTHMTERYTHMYGTHERMSRTRIRITLTQLPNLGS